jgi:hypothetical protein
LYTTATLWVPVECPQRLFAGAPPGPQRLFAGAPPGPQRLFTGGTARPSEAVRWGHRPALLLTQILAALCRPLAVKFS